MSWHAKKEETILKELKTGYKGLTEEEAKKRIEKFGKNELVKIKRLTGLKIFLRQFASFLVLILIVAAIISGLLKHWVDFSVIIGIVILNAMFGFAQEYKAEKSIENLKEMLVPKAKVLRNNKLTEIDARDIVPGDILVLNEGDKVMADARVLVSENLQTNEASLTGESNPSDKIKGELPLDTPLTERANIVYQGTEITRGNGYAVVFSTGMNTEFGKIAGLVQKVEHERSPLIKKINHFAKQLGFLAIGLIILVSIVGIYFGIDKIEIFLTAVSLAVSAIPEGLPAVVTITLALATQRMLKFNSLIRKLPAVETLGRATVICVDKTGTITEEKMQVKQIYVDSKIYEKFPKNQDTEFLFLTGILCSHARFETANGENGIEERYIGDPTEKALLIAAKEYGLHKKSETEKQPKIKEFPFTSERKMMAKVRQKGSEQISYVKGAPEVIVKRCNYELRDGKVVEISEKRKRVLIEEYEKMASEGLRVLGFAYKKIIGSITQEKAERNLVFIGFQGMIDPPRQEIKKAVSECESAGIRVVMLTGDSALTAKAVGEEIGLKGEIIDASELDKMSEEDLAREIDKTAIFARISPKDKLRIVDILKKKGEIVAVTGDGINDAPALKRADIGIAVNRGTDVAKDSSDIILIDNNFASIVNGVKEGRRVYDNIKKFVKYLLSANTNEITLILFSLVIGLPLPLLPLQILWLNLVTDSFPALSLSVEEAEAGIMKRKPSKEGILKNLWFFVIFVGILSFVISFIAFYLYVDNIEKARTMAVTTTVVFEMFLVFNCKSKESVFKSPLNRYMFYAVALSFGLHLIAVYTKVSLLFKFTFLGFADWGVVLGMCIPVFIVLEFIKKHL